MKIQFPNDSKDYKEVIEMLKSNHPDYETEIVSSLYYNDKKSGSIIAKIGEKYYEANNPDELYEKIVDHFFRLPNCFIG